MNEKPIKWSCIKSDEIVFVSTNINKESALIVEKMCNLIVRENFGYDFWSYKVGIESILNKKSLDSILLVNSSVIYFNPDKLINEFWLPKVGFTALSVCMFQIPNR